MSKKIIRMEAMDPIEIYGAANKNLEALCSYFPELKVVARGNEIILEGSYFGRYALHVIPVFIACDHAASTSASRMVHIPHNTIASMHDRLPAHCA